MSPPSRKKGRGCKTLSRSGLNKPFTPSRSGVVRQVELPCRFVGWMSADIQKVKCPSLLCRRFLAPCFEVTLLAVVVSVAFAMARGGLRPALALVDGVMVVNLLTCADRLSTKIAGHYISMPPILCDFAQRVCGQSECSQAFLIRTSLNCLEPCQASCSSSCCSSSI